MIAIEIRTTKETEHSLTNFPQEVRKALQAAMVKVADFAERESFNSLGKTGYPQNRSFELRDSIYSRTQPRDLSVFLGASKFYAKFLEEGTRHIDPPLKFLRPAFTKNREKLRRMIDNHVQMELNK